MIGVLLDVWREARSRRWFLLLFVAVTLVLLVLTFFLKLEIVDGALTASRLFGLGSAAGDIQPVDVALRPVFRAFAKVLFYGGLLFGILACSEFAPNLLAPGRIELLLSFPVSRARILIGTFVALAGAALIFAAYATLGVTLVFWFKAEVFLPEFIYAGGLAVVTFLPIYAAMLLSAVIVRSTALSAAAGVSVFIMGLFASYRDVTAAAFSNSWVRASVDGTLRLFPPIATLAEHPTETAPQMMGTLVLALALVSLAIFVIEGKDF